MYMSLTAADLPKITDPEKRQLAEAFLSLRAKSDEATAKLESINKKTLDDATAARQRRIERVCGAVSAKNRDKILAAAAAPSAMLSMGADQKITDPLAMMLEVFEEELKGMPDLLRNGAKFSETTHPVDTGVMTEAQAEALVNQQMRTPVPQKA